MIYKSESIDKLACALSHLQGELHDAYKSSSGYGYNYAELTTVFETIRPLLKKYELSVTQPVGGSNNMIELNTILMHSSGQYISSIVSVPVDLTNKKMNSLQAAGSTITYLRRYCVCSIIGLATTDDDGKAGGESIDASYQVKQKAPYSPSAHANVAQPIAKKQPYTDEEVKALEEKFREQVGAKNVPTTTIIEWCTKAGVKHIGEFTGEQYEKLLKYMDNRTFQDGDV